jgi:D-inositol-3-phosphate glycosyltransferase
MKDLTFGSLDTNPVKDLKNPEGDMICGAQVAGQTFYRALLKYGTFNEYHFFVRPAETDYQETKILNSHSNSHLVKLIKNSVLPEYLQKQNYSVFFTCSPDLSRLAYMRNRFSDADFPVCGVAYTVSVREDLESCFFHNQIADLRSYDSIICISRSQAKAIEKLYEIVSHSLKKEKGMNLKYRGRLDILPLGVEAQSFGQTDKMESRLRLDLPWERVIILYFGRFSLYDKMDIYPLLLAFKELSANNNKIMLLLAGNNAQMDYASKVKKMAGELEILSGIKFYLDPSDAEKRLLYSASDIFVSPSDNLQESFGLTNLEAMASGLPVVASDWNGIRDVVIHGETGLLVPTYWADCSREISVSSPIFENWQLDHLLIGQSVAIDAKKMQESLASLVNNKALRLKFGGNAKRRVLENYDWKTLIPKYEELWKELDRTCDEEKHTEAKSKTEIFVPDYFYCFSHYPSRMLEDETNIAITDQGSSLLRTKKMPAYPAELQDKISRKAVFLVLMYLLDKRAVPLNDVEGYLQKLFKGMSSSQIRYHVLWLIKKNCISVLDKN